MVGAGASRDKQVDQVMGQMLLAKTPGDYSSGDERYHRQGLWGIKDKKDKMPSSYH